MMNQLTTKQTTRACLVGVLALIGSTVFAEQVEVVQPGALEFMVINEGLPEVIQYLSAHSDLRTQMSDNVQGRIRARHLTGTPVSILSDLAIEYDLDWFAFNGTHYLDTKRNATTRIIPLEDLSFERAISALEQAEIPTQQYLIRSAADGNALVMSGPPKLLGIVEALVLSTSADVEVLPKVLIRRANQVTDTLETAAVSN